MRLRPGWCDLRCRHGSREAGEGRWGRNSHQRCRVGRRQDGKQEQHADEPEQHGAHTVDREHPERPITTRGKPLRIPQCRQHGIGPQISDVLFDVAIR